MNSVIYDNLLNFKPQEGVNYKSRYEDILKNKQIKRDAGLYINQQGTNIYSHLNNLYLAVVRKYVLEDNFFIFYFVRSHLKPVRHDFVVQMCANTDHDMELYESGKVNDFLEMRARGHLKSCDNESLALRCILKYPESSTCFIAFRHKSAQGSMEVVKKIMEMGEIKHAFTDVLRENPKDKTWSLRDGLVVERKFTGRTKTVECCGFYEGINTGQHYRFLFVDDIMTKEMARSEGQIMIGKENFPNIRNMAFFGVEGESSMIRVTGTPYAYDDVVMMVNDMIHTEGAKKGEKVFKIRKIREANDEDEPCFVTQSQHEYNKSSDMYRSQQQLDPSPLQIESLNYDDLVEVDVIPDNLFQWIVVDPAGDITKFDQADKDNHAIVVMGAEMERDINGMFNLYILDIEARNMSEDEAPHVIASMYQKHRGVHCVAIEQTYSGYLATMVVNLIKQRTGISFMESDSSLIRLKPQSRGNKKNNINKTLYPMTRGHKLHINEKIPSVYKNVLRTEMRTFPTGKRDDILDAMSYYPIILEKNQFDYRLTQYQRNKNPKITYMSDIKRKLRMSRVPYNQNNQYMNW